VLLPHVTNGFGQSGLVAPITSAATKLKVLQHPHVAVYRIAQNSQVMSIGGRDVPGLDTALLLPHWAGLTFQVDVKQRRAPGRRTGNVEPLPVQRPAHSAKTIPSRHTKSRGAPPPSGSRRIRFSPAGNCVAIWEPSGERSQLYSRPEWVAILVTSRPLPFNGIECRKDEVFLILSLLSHQAQGGRSPCAPVIEIAMGR